MNPRILLSLLALPLGLSAQVPPPPPNPPPPPAADTPPAAGQLGGPLPGLPAAGRAAFAEGFAAFAQRETADSGLGPIFNDVSCISCHGNPAPGGGSRRNVVRFGRMTDNVFDSLERLGGPLLQDRALRPGLRESVPSEANVVARRITTPLFGAGLIEAIPDSTLRALAAKPGKPDGIKGRVSVVTDVASGVERVGRFGWKAQQATLLAFSADAYANEMGVTNRYFRSDNAPNGKFELLDRADRILDPEDEADPETGRGDIDRVADYMRLLAAPPRRGPVNAPQILAGQAVFNSLNCVECHTPSLRTGPSSIPALAHKTVPLYSDLLLHDMGALGDGIPQGSAGPRDMRTAPLWGLGRRNTYLHDGRATTLDAAIRAHDGEAAASRARYTRLDAARQRNLMEFLRSL
jgi:CxxC motif-containing protein (DUF1111 family)